MAKESMKARERKRERLVARYEKKRAELTKVLKSTDSSEEIQSAKWDAMMQLQKLPANSSKIRMHNRCGLTGRPRGYMRQFGISRVTFREMALAGKIPGVKNIILVAPQFDKSSFRYFALLESATSSGNINNNPDDYCS